MADHLVELYAYRALIWTLVVRDLKARYRGSVLGFLWTFLNPILLMATYTLIFSVYMRVDMQNYAAFLLTGLIPWIWFSSSLLMGATSVVEGGGLLKKVFLPPQALPAVTVLANFVNFLLTLPLLIGFLTLFGIRLGWSVAAILPLMAIQLVFTYGLTLIVAALTVRYRDLAQLLSNLLTLWFFLSPIIYPASLVPAKFSTFLALNPMAPLLMGYQNAMLYKKVPVWSLVGAVAIGAVGVLVVGTLVFDRFRWKFAEEV